MTRRTAPNVTPDDLIAAAADDRDRSVLDMVREALQAGRVMLAFQPVVGAVAGEVAFHEGLIRLRDTTGRIIPAAQFIDAVETDELGREIDCAALRLGLAVLAQVPTLRLSINMSARSIGYARWARTLIHGLSQDQTVGERLILEITERSAMQVPELVKSFMTDLQERGITFALDDFGAGQTSFRYLKEFCFDVLKIEGSFIKNCDTDPDNQCILNALISIGQQFDMFTVAEAVETAAEAQFLTDAGIDCLQGYYYGSPQIRPPWLPDVFDTHLRDTG